MTAIKSAVKQRTFSSTHNKTHQKSNKNRFSPLDFTVAGPSTVVKISSNPVDLQPFDLEDLTTDEEAEEWIVQNRGKHKQTLDTIAEEPEGMLQFTKEDVKVEMDFWKHSVVCFILGANPPWDVVEDFIHHLWADYGVERVSFLPSGIFLAVWDCQVLGTPMFKLVSKLKQLKQPLKDLNKALFDDVENNALRAWKVLEYTQELLRADPANSDLISSEVAALKEYQDLQKAADSFLLQKSKAIWLKEGYTNSKVFHSYIKGRQAKNKVFRITNDHGQWINDADQIQASFLAFYQTLLGTADQVQPVNIQVVQRDFFTHGKLLKQLNHTLVTLIPKVEMPENVTQFRPISCCNVVYKVIAKLLCTRLAAILPHIISPNQGGFIKRRNIIENILVCQDVIRLYKRTAVSPRCMIKVDLRKAYDSVDWGFPKQMMLALNFPPQFLNLIMEYITSASYSLVLNGEQFGHFPGKKGLRQGDPLSPLLFTIAMEYLTRILHFTTDVLDFKFHSLCGKLRLQHLMFADDLLMFSKGDLSSVRVLLRSFVAFSAASGLYMNQQKSNIYFNGVHQHKKAQILSISGCQEGQLPFKYLGVPITAGKLGKRECQALVEKIVEKIRAVGARKCSYAGRLVIVQSVLTSLYSYWANIFLIPKGVLRKIDSICRNYMWDGTSNYVRSPLVSWEQVCVPKLEGGLGIRYSLTWNKATIGKLVWWIYSKPDSLWVKWVHQLYLKGCWLATQTGYTVNSGYEWLRHKEQKVGWAKLVWNSWSLPKHSFLAWLIFRNALNVREKLFRHGITTMNECCICHDAEETVTHLFQQCEYAKLIIAGVSLRMNIPVPTGNGVIWLGRRKWTQIKKSVSIGGILATYHAIWYQRN
ncbi:uncharacterized protein LOC141614161 [Silene latifolia]|uniref:uncharacterized protein LOC141614161 n=1 Tax=Silene latifolia TaxID=37657 RepID=UPI003D77ED92